MCNGSTDQCGWRCTLARVARRLGLDHPTAKTGLARIIREANPKAQITPIRGDIADDQVAQQLRSCDFLFLAAGTMLPGDVINQLAYQYLIRHCRQSRMADGREQEKADAGQVTLRRGRFQYAKTLDHPRRNDGNHHRRPRASLTG